MFVSKRGICRFWSQVNNSKPTIKGVNLWNYLKTANKQCRTLHMFKAKFRITIIREYETKS